MLNELKEQTKTPNLHVYMGKIESDFDDSGSESDYIRSQWLD